MKAVVFDRFGEPGEVLQTRDVPVPVPGRGEVRVRMLMSPVNPSDLMSIRGRYGKLPRLPVTPGFEGVGVVDAAGPGLIKMIRGLKPGRRVAVLNAGGGNWAEQVVIPARQAVPIADGIPDEQAAAFFVNPATTLIMVRYVHKVLHGDWLLQSAAGSAVGRMVIRLGKLDGFHTINLVRRREQAAELKRLGADEVIVTTEESIEERVQAITGGKGVLHALDCVGGETGAAMARTLGENGRLLVYGTLSNEPITLDPRQLMVAARRIEGFWLSIWMRQQRTLRLLGLFRQLNQLIKEGVLGTEVGATFPLEDVQNAVKQAEAAGKAGKVLLKIAR